MFNEKKRRNDDSDGGRHSGQRHVKDIKSPKGDIRKGNDPSTEKKRRRGRQATTDGMKRQVKSNDSRRIKRRKSNNNKHGPPSQEALELSSQLKQLSREKKLEEALSLYRDASRDKIRDGTSYYHYSAIFSCEVECMHLQSHNSSFFSL
jgi:hypothetical protein